MRWMALPLVLANRLRKVIKHVPVRALIYKANKQKAPRITRKVSSRLERVRGNWLHLFPA